MLAEKVSLTSFINNILNESLCKSLYTLNCLFYFKNEPNALIKVNLDILWLIMHGVFLPKVSFF